MQQTIISIKLEMDSCKSCIRERKSCYRLKSNLKMYVNIQLKVLKHKQKSKNIE